MEAIKKALNKASEKYSKQIVIRALIQTIPYIGSSLDTLFAGKGSQIQFERLKHFLEILKEKLEKIEKDIYIQPSEEFFDLMVNIFDGVIKTRIKEKRERFANIIINKIINESTRWDEAEIATRLLKELDEIHIRILIEGINAPICGSPFNGLKVITLKESKSNIQGPVDLKEKFPEYEIEVLRMVCAELVSRGLLYDEGIGRWDVKSMEYFTATKLAEWWLKWIIADIK